jgi:hypothetical protein
MTTLNVIIGSYAALGTIAGSFAAGWLSGIVFMRWQDRHKPPPF